MNNVFYCRHSRAMRSFQAIDGFKHLSCQKVQRRIYELASQIACINGHCFPVLKNAELNSLTGINQQVFPGTVSSERFICIVEVLKTPSHNAAHDQKHQFIPPGSFHNSRWTEEYREFYQISKSSHAHTYQRIDRQLLERGGKMHLSLGSNVGGESKVTYAVDKLPRWTPRHLFLLSEY